MRIGLLYIFVQYFVRNCLYLSICDFYSAFKISIAEIFGLVPSEILRFILETRAVEIQHGFKVCLGYFERHWIKSAQAKYNLRGSCSHCRWRAPYNVYVESWSSVRGQVGRVIKLYSMEAKDKVDLTCQQDLRVCQEMHQEVNWPKGVGSVWRIGYEGEIDHPRWCEGLPNTTFYRAWLLSWDVDGFLEFVPE